MPVAIGFAVVSSLLFFWMLAQARHAWRALPPGAPVPVHGGLGGWDRWRPKESALILWPAIAGLIWLVDLGVMIYSVADAAGRSKDAAALLAAPLILPIVTLLISQHLALRAAAARAARESPLTAEGRATIGY